MISDMDENIGKVLERLDELGLTENTMIVFTSDNGATHPGRDPAFHIGGADPPFFNSAAGLRGWKGSVYEGGIRIPCVVKWPGMIAPGSTNALPTYFPDWFPTLAKAANATVPNDLGLDGMDLTETLQTGTQSKRSGPLLWEFAGYRGQIAVRDGRWKAVRQGVRSKKPSAWELYDLESDRAESNNVASEHPDILTRLKEAYLKTRTPEPDFPLPLYDNPS
jgi:arylsulfatase